MGIFARLGVTAAEIEQLVQASPSLRGVLIGYLAETKLAHLWFSKYKLHKYDDHDRQRKGDRWIPYKGHEISIEVKSLQTASVVQTAAGTFVGRFQCDASDRRPVRFPDGSTIETTCLLVGQFDLLAVNCFEFGQEWKFAFVKNSDLPRSKYKKYTDYQRQFLLQTTPTITWPLQPPYRGEPWSLLDEIAASKTH
ncbi:MAG: restriction endonuclease [Planctomycetia bacterium]|nr:restriction endonuclease [Planctomycetia bacterium]